MSTMTQDAMPAAIENTSAQQAFEILHATLGSRVVRAPAEVAGTHRDWSDAPSHQPLAILLPTTTEEVSQALALCHAHGIPVAIQGGLTGLAGGANAFPGEVALSLAKLNRIEQIDDVAGTATVQAGVTLEQLQQAADECGWFFPLDLGARGSCQLGGNAATNAGGNRVIRYGMMRDAVLGLEVVLADGTRIERLDAVIKNNAGFDLKQIFLGSEGLMGVITKLVLKLEPRPNAKCTALCAVNGFGDAAALLRVFKKMLPELAAFELMWSEYLEASATAQRLPLPFAQPCPLYVLVETLGDDEKISSTALERALEHAIETGIVNDAILSQSGDQSQHLWDYREGISELLSALKPCAAFDVSVALPKMEELVHELKVSLAANFPKQQHLFFGHLGDGNLHLVTGPYVSTDELLKVEELVYQQVGARGGSISAEHGIGIVKKDFLHHSRSHAELDLMRKLKTLLDPKSILNRGRVLNAPT